MKQRTYLIIILIFFGEALIVLGFMHFFSFMEARILVLNTTVTSVIFLFYMTRLLQPRYNFRERSQKVFAGLGIRAYAMLTYTIAAFWLMFHMNAVLPQSLMTQVLVQASLLFLLGLGLFFSVTAADKAEQVFEEQSGQRAALDNARRIAAGIAEKTLRSNLPQQEKTHINGLIADLRFIAPGNTAEAAHLEALLATELERLDTLLSLPAPDVGKINEILLNIESLYRQRKQVYAY